MPVVVAYFLLVGAGWWVVKQYAEGSRHKSSVYWDPVWLGGEGPWGIKIYKWSGPLRGLREKQGRDWRVEILFDGEFCQEQKMTGGEDFARSWANLWIEQHPEGC